VRSHAVRFAFALFGAAALRADDSLAHARHAQALLGPDVWSQVIHIENDARSDRYPRTLHALVFQLAGVLWFYADTDGTQSFSRRRGKLAEDMADFGPLLHDIEPGFRRWHLVLDEPGAPPVRGELPNGCFIESVAALHARLTGGGETIHPQLLAYYVDTAAGLRGHTVLTYESGGWLKVLDTQQSGAARRFPVAAAHDPLALAQALAGDRVTKARVLALAPTAPRVAGYAALPEEPPAKRGLLMLR
jgi:hypothetical protein